MKRECMTDDNGYVIQIIFTFEEDAIFSNPLPIQECLASFMRRNARIPITFKTKSFIITIDITSDYKLAIAETSIDDEEKHHHLIELRDLPQYFQTLRDRITKQASATQSNLCYYGQFVLSSMHCVYSPLFYTTHLSSIAKMSYANHPRMILFHDVSVTALKIFMLGRLFFQEDFSLPKQLFFTTLFYALVSRQSQNIQSDFKKTVFCIAAQLFFTGIGLMFTLYKSLPETELQKTIVMPRYGLYFIEQWMQTFLSIIIQTMCLHFLFFCIKKTINNKILNHEIYQAGFSSGAILIAHAIQYAMNFFNLGIIHLNGWQDAQKAEEKLLTFLNDECEHQHCQLSIQEYWFSRILGYFFPAQTLHWSADRGERVVTRCVTTITTQDKEAQYDLQCIYRYWPRILSPHQGLLPSTDFAKKRIFNETLTASL